VDVRDLLRREAWDVQELKEARRQVGPHGFQPGRGAILMQRADHLSERRADARDLAQATLRNNIRQRHGQREQVLGGSRIGLRSIGALACKAEPPAELDEKSSHGRSIVHGLVQSRHDQRASIRIGPAVMKVS
jgi:hypothetical protein